MATALWMLGFCAALAFIFALASDRASYIFNSLRSGASIWAQLIPICCLILYYYILTTNLVSSPLPYSRHLNMAFLFSHSEISFFFVAGIALLTRFSSLVGLLLASYAIQKLYFSDVLVGPFLAGPALFCAVLIVLSLLGDCVPWVDDPSQKQLGDKLREIFILIFSYTAMACLFACLLKFPEFQSWLSQQHDAFDAKSRYIILSMVVLFLGWLGVALGIARQLLIPFLALPSIVATSFLTQWSPTLLLVFYIAILTTGFIGRRTLVYSATRVTYL